MKTIKQIADDIGVSKTAIRKKMPPEVKTKFAETRNRVIYISPEGEKLIRAAFSQREPETEFPQVSEVSANWFASVSGEVSAVIATLQEQLQVKDRQITDLIQNNRELTVALENTTAALIEAQRTARAAQALHAGTIHQQLTDGAEQEESKVTGLADQDSQSRESVQVKNEKPRHRWWPFGKKM